MARTMKAIIKEKAGPGLKLVERPVPSCGPGDVLIKITATAICGTDVHIYKWDRWSAERLRPPLIIGHEFSGCIEEVGPGVKGLAVGDRVTAEMHISCGICYQCRTGKAHICKDVVIRGVDGDGIFADYAALPAGNVWKLHPSIPDEIASIHDPIGNAVHTVFEADVAGHPVLILGCGPIGCAAVDVARACGATFVVASDINPYRLDLAKKMGADRIVNTTEERVEDVVMEMTGGLGVNVVLEMSGSPDAIQSGLAVLRAGGRMALLGLPSKPIELHLSRDVIFKGATLLGINGRRMFDTWYQMEALITGRRVDFSRLVTHRFPMCEFDKGMELMSSGNSGKVILLP
ncbi:MAG: L-threonine 3-dehydrogenase [Acidobacteriota bacterium]